MFSKLLIGAAAAALASTSLAAAPSAGHPSRDTMWFADAYASAFYALDQDRHEVVIRTDAGPKGGNPIVVRRTMKEGTSERVTISGTGQNRLRATLTVSRRNGRLAADVKTEGLLDRQASK